mmetsp:Transcript_24221/g.33893  ORF Transcript_24221/g.33893 Transcript_24221/m.33893 type:complete len:87 (-) Transcript_24221:25-285(-)
MHLTIMHCSLIFTQKVLLQTECKWSPMSAFEHRLNETMKNGACHVDVCGVRALHNLFLRKIIVACNFEQKKTSVVMRVRTRIICLV